MITEKQKMNSKDFVHSILQKTDLSKPAINIFILDRGDWSRYHETVVLKYWKSKWSLIENYLTPEYSFCRESQITNIQCDNIHIWLEQLVLKNEDVFLRDKNCPPTGLFLP